jgi:Tol biopolymer transport system component
VELLLFSSIIVGIAVGHFTGPPLSVQESQSLALREKVVNATLAQKDLFDCSIYVPDSNPILPPEQQIFQVVRDGKITPDDGKDYTGAFWSPKGDAVVFVAPTREIQPIQESDTLPSAGGEPPRLMGISKNQLMLYSLASGTWAELTSDGLSPAWAQDGQSIYYLAGTNLMKAEVDTRIISRTDLSVPDTGVGLSLSRPLSDGRILAPRSPHAPLELLGAKTPTPSPIGVGDGDIIILSPGQDRVVVGYGATSTPAVTVTYDLLSGTVAPLLKDCQAAATQMVWSPAGNRIAYPLRGERSEIRIYDLGNDQTQVLVRLDTGDLLSGLSWSPDGKYLAFTQGDDGPGTARSIWIASTDGTTRQLLVNGGLLPNWSPAGKHILYARAGTSRLLDWYLLEVNSTVQ